MAINWDSLSDNSQPLVPKPEDLMGLMHMMNGGPPQVEGELAPKVTRMNTPEETNLSQDQGQLQKMRTEDANPYGSPNNHPGFWGKVGHIAAKVGNIAGDVLAPGTMALIPGTQLNRNVSEAGLSHKVGQEEAEVNENDQRRATTSKTEAETAALPGENQSKEDLEEAQTKNLNSETTARDNPKDTYAVHDTPNGPLFVNMKTGQAQHLSVDGTPIGPKIATKTVQLEVGGKPHQMLINELDGTPIKDLGESGEKPATVNVNSGEAALDRESKQFGGAHQKSLDASNAQLEKIADARSMINGSAESQALGLPKVLTALVSGQGSGVRITQAELNSIAKARGISGDVEGTLNSLAGKGKLSSTQKQQLTQIMDDVKTRILQKQAIASQALDTINGASTREQIVQADKDARKKLADMESGVGTAPQGADNEVYVKGKLVGHTVGGKYVPLAK